MRKLATIRTISALDPIPDADAIEVATVDGWKVVVKKNEFSVGEHVLYLEIDSWVPHELAPFLSKGKEPRVYEGVRGEKLRTVKLRGALSQGLILPLHSISVEKTGENFLDIPLNRILSMDSVMDLVEKTDKNFLDILDISLNELIAISGSYLKDIDFAPYFKIKKWEAEIPAQLAGQVLGVFPSFIRKTDQERCLSGDTLVKTSTGEISIEEICQLPKNNLPKVWSLNHETGETELKNIVSTSIIPNGGRWLKIITKTGKTLILTDNHRVWCEDMQDYILSADLKIGQKIILKD